MEQSSLRAKTSHALRAHSYLVYWIFISFKIFCMLIISSSRMSKHRNVRVSTQIYLAFMQKHWTAREMTFARRARIWCVLCTRYRLSARARAYMSELYLLRVSGILSWWVESQLFMEGDTYWWEFADNTRKRIGIQRGVMGKKIMDADSFKYTIVLVI